MSPYFLGFVAHSGSGKTTLIEKIIEIFAQKGKKGYKIWDIPKIEVHRKETNSEYLIENGVENIILVATNETEKQFGVPVLHIDDIKAIADFIEKAAERHK